MLPKILLYGFIGINAVIMLGGTYVIYDIKLSYQRPEINESTETGSLAKEREAKDTRSVILSMDPFVANLDGAPKKVLRTTIHLEMLNEEGYEEAMDLGPVARDQIMRILNSKNFHDIETIQGKLFLKDQIVVALNGLLKQGTIKEIYFGEFVVQ